MVASLRVRSASLEERCALGAFHFKSASLKERYALGADFLLAFNLKTQKGCSSRPEGPLFVLI
jgi:hypothetical protein